MKTHYLPITKTSWEYIRSGCVVFMSTKEDVKSGDLLIVIAEDGKEEMPTRFKAINPRIRKFSSCAVCVFEIAEEEAK